MNYYTKERIKEGIEHFKERSKTELDFCLELFEYATIRLLAHKYAYYELNKHIVNDEAYDSEEKGWYVMGFALGKLKEDETSPCVGFDPNHSLASKAIELANKLIL